MLATILAFATPIVPLVIKLIGMWLDSNAQAEESKKKFVEFLQAMSGDGLISKKLHDSFESQKAENLKKIEDLEKSKNK